MRAFPVLVVRTINVISIFLRHLKKKGILTENVKFVELDWENFVRYVKTRWFSLQQC